MEPQSSMYAALQPVPKIQPIFILGSVYAEAISVPVVSLIKAASRMGTPWDRQYIGLLYESEDLMRTYPSSKSSLKHRDHILALDALDVEALGPAL